MQTEDVSAQQEQVMIFNQVCAKYTELFNFVNERKGLLRQSSRDSVDHLQQYAELAEKNKPSPELDSYIKGTHHAAPGGASASGASATSLLQDNKRLVALAYELINKYTPLYKAVEGRMNDMDKVSTRDKASPDWAQTYVNIHAIVNDNKLTNKERDCLFAIYSRNINIGQDREKPLLSASAVAGDGEAMSVSASVSSSGRRAVKHKAPQSTSGAPRKLPRPAGPPVAVLPSGGDDAVAPATLVGAGQHSGGGGSAASGSQRSTTGLKESKKPYLFHIPEGRASTNNRTLLLELFQLFRAYLTFFEDRSNELKPSGAVEDQSGSVVDTFGQFIRANKLPLEMIGFIETIVRFTIDKDEPSAAALRQKNTLSYLSNIRARNGDHNSGAQIVSNEKYDKQINRLFLELYEIVNKYIRFVKEYTDALRQVAQGEDDAVKLYLQVFDTFVATHKPSEGLGSRYRELNSNTGCRKFGAQQNKKLTRSIFTKLRKQYTDLSGFVSTLNGGNELMPTTNLLPSTLNKLACIDPKYSKLKRDSFGRKEMVQLRSSRAEYRILSAIIDLAAKRAELVLFVQQYGASLQEAIDGGKESGQKDLEDLKKIDVKIAANTLTEQEIKYITYATQRAERLEGIYTKEVLTEVVVEQPVVYNEGVSIKARGPIEAAAAATASSSAQGNVIRSNSLTDGAAASAAARGSAPDSTPGSGTRSAAPIDDDGGLNGYESGLGGDGGDNHGSDWSSLGFWDGNGGGDGAYHGAEPGNLPPFAI